MEKQVVLIGASGYVGRAILNELLERGWHVKALVRHPQNITLKNPALSVEKVDVSDEQALAAALQGCPLVISSYNPGWTNPDIYEHTLKNYKKILEAAKAAHVRRLLIVGGAGSLFVAPGLRLMDTGKVPEAILPGVRSLAEFYLGALTKEDGIDWVFFSPAGVLGNADRTPGVRTGRYRLGKDDLIVDAQGNSFISVEDYAKAMVDELEEGAHHKERFTIGY
ncbi:MAG: NAD(P)H-binding protein [Desulfovibrio sp.]|uniref:NAD(P)-dependent oxidoreductase n=1 Tax=Desulfovibrio sp. TaxID=885 RepID=UPI001A74DB71|nr:NAD(P)H-binding protein [Desulfovibrio sp.]MBD5418381.1 NAD(P)H-binding protein [Desulfovibrio sp.]